MSLNGGDVIAKVLKSQGVPFVFTLCGGHISPILVGCRKAGIRVVDTRGEAGAVFAADAAARLTGVPGVAIVTAGPGVTNTFTAAKNAQMAQVPLVLIGGASATILKGRGSLQDIDQLPLLLSIVKMAESIQQNCDIVPVLEGAFTIARSGVPGPVFIECPIDLLYDEELVRSWYGAGSDQKKPHNIVQKVKGLHLKHHVDRVFSCDFESMEPNPKDLHSLAASHPETQKAIHLTAKAIHLTAKAERPVMVLGSQALLHPAQAGTLAEAVSSLGIPVYLAGMARGLMGASHPLHMRHKRRDALKDTDLVILAGMPCDFRLDYGRVINSAATLISVNRSKVDLSLNRKPSLAIHGDPYHFLVALANHPEYNPGKKWAAWQDRLRETDQRREKEIDAMAGETDQGVNPIRFFKKLDKFLKDNSILIADGGDFVATAAYNLHPRKPLQWLDPGVFGTLGVGGGFALGAKLARPDSEVWILYGDGSAGYSLQELDTFVRHGLPVIAVVGNDAGWTQIARDQVAVFKDDVGTVLRHTDYHIVAEGFGAKGILVEREDQIEEALQQARTLANTGRPVLINLLISPTDFRKGSLSV
jgi:thiamine pyrophosphate-dependent acetolactate synthase large subunit-like protein